MELKPGYKQTEVGVIPEDWSISCISDLTNLVGDGIHTTPIYSNNGDYFFINGNNLSGGNVVLTEDTKRVDHSEYLKHKKKLDNRTIFISINGTIGNLAFYNNESVVLGKSAAYLNVKERFSKKYLYYSLQTNVVLQHFEDGLTGTTLKNLGLGTIRNTPIQHPSTKAEQTAIANALSDADALIQSLTSLIAKKHQIKQGAMQTLLNPYENGRLKEGWMVKKLGELIFLQGGYAFRSEKFRKSGIPIIRISNIQEGKVNENDVVYYGIGEKIPREFHIKMGDSLIAMSGATTGKAGVYSGNLLSYQNQRVGKFVVKNNTIINSKFVHQLVCSGQFISTLSKELEQGAQPNISAKQIENLEFGVPIYEEQMRISTILSDMDAEIAALEAKFAKYRHIKQGMMQNLLTGRIRLAQPDSNTGAAA